MSWQELDVCCGALSHRRVWSLAESLRSLPSQCGSWAVGTVPGVMCRTMLVVCLEVHLVLRNCFAVVEGVAVLTPELSMGCNRGLSCGGETFPLSQLNV